MHTKTKQLFCRNIYTTKDNIETHLKVLFNFNYLKNVALKWLLLILHKPTN